MTHTPDLGADARSLLEAVTAISSDLDLDLALTRIIEAATALTGARYGALGVLGRDGELVEFVTTGIDDRTRAAIGDLRIINSAVAQSAINDEFRVNGGRASDKINL